MTEVQNISKEQTTSEEIEARLTQLERERGVTDTGEYSPEEVEARLSRLESEGGEMAARGVEQVKIAGGTAEQIQRADGAGEALKKNLQAAVEEQRAFAQKYRSAAQATSGESQKVWEDKARFYERGAQTAEMRVEALSPEKVEPKGKAIEMARRMADLNMELGRNRAELETVRRKKEIGDLKERRRLEAVVAEQSRQLIELRAAMKKEQEQKGGVTPKEAPQREMPRVEIKEEPPVIVSQKAEEELPTQRSASIREFIEKAAQQRASQEKSVEAPLPIREFPKVEVSEPSTKEVPVQAQVVQAMKEAAKEGAPTREVPIQAAAVREMREKAAEAIPSGLATREIPQEETAETRAIPLEEIKKAREDFKKDFEAKPESLKTAGQELRERDAMKEKEKEKGSSRERVSLYERGKKLFGKAWESALVKGAPLFLKLGLLRSTEEKNNWHTNRINRATLQEQLTLEKLNRVEERLGEEQEALERMINKYPDLNPVARREQEKRIAALEKLRGENRAAHQRALTTKESFESRKMAFEDAKGKIFEATSGRLDGMIKTAEAKADVVEEEMRRLRSIYRARQEELAEIVEKSSQMKKQSEADMHVIEKRYDAQKLQELSLARERKEKKILECEREFEALNKRRKKLNQRINALVVEWNLLKPKSSPEEAPIQTS